MMKNSKTDDLAESFRVEPWVHYLGGFVQRSRGFWKWLGNMESGLLAGDLAAAEVRQPVYVTGLARSGSTLLLELLNRHPDLIAHYYQDYPLLYTPYMWNRYLERIPQDYTPKERSHRDGIFITPESPEAFEEILWMAYFPDQHNPQRTAVLDGQTENPAFEKFYRDHIRKLLLVRGGRRYLAKGNYNITRLAYLLKIFEDARFVIPVREPIWHIASLMRQQKRFQEGQQANSRALAHVQRIGHFEFGLDRRPIHTGDDARVAHILDLWANGAEVEGWATYWSLIHDFLYQEVNRPDLSAAVHVVRYEVFCSSAAESVHRLFAHCNLEIDASLLAEAVSLIKPPSLVRPEMFSEQDLAIIDRCTADSAHRLGLGRRDNVRMAS
jgi:hypothetical protein